MRGHHAIPRTRNRRYRARHRRFPRNESFHANGASRRGRLGLKVVVWTVNDACDMAAVARLGVDGIITDHPDRAIETLQP